MESIRCRETGAAGVRGAVAARAARWYPENRAVQAERYYFVASGTVVDWPPIVSTSGVDAPGLRAAGSFTFTW